MSVMLVDYRIADLCRDTRKCKVSVWFERFSMHALVLLFKPWSNAPSRNSDVRQPYQCVQGEEYQVIKQRSELHYLVQDL